MLSVGVLRSFPLQLDHVRDLPATLLLVLDLGVQLQVASDSVPVPVGILPRLRTESSPTDLWVRGGVGRGDRGGQGWVGGGLGEGAGGCVSVCACVCECVSVCNVCAFVCVCLCVNCVCMCV